MNRDSIVSDLLSGEFVSRLDRLDVLSRKILSGKLSGERRARRRGNSVEFADFRDYSPGDDPRFIDWNACARLDRLLLKLFVAEEDSSLHLLIDSSKSMDWGLPAKAMYLKQLAAALGYVGLVNQHHVRAYSFADGIVGESGSLRGRGNAARLMHFLSGMKPAGASGFARACEALAMSRQRKGVCIVLSDFYFPGEFARGLQSLRAAGHEIWCVQVLSPQELAPVAAGDLRLNDIEDKTTVAGRVDDRMIEQYRRNLQTLCDDLERQAIGAGGHCILASTNTPVDALVLNCLREQGLLG